MTADNDKVHARERTRMITKKTKPEYMWSIVTGHHEMYSPVTTESTTTTLRMYLSNEAK